MLQFFDPILADIAPRSNVVVPNNYWERWFLDQSHHYPPVPRTDRTDEFLNTYYSGRAHWYLIPQETMTVVENTGPIVLVGGDEFGPRCESMDRELLDLRPSARLAVAVVPTAAAGQHPEMAAANGTRYFESLGAEAREVMAVGERSGSDEDILRPLASSGLIYFAGGGPSHLLHVLESTKLWGTVRFGWAAGAVLAGSSAGAMVMGGWMLAAGEPPSWVRTIGAVANVAVLPRYERWGTERRDRAVATRPSGITLLGISGAGGVVFERDAAEGRVIGDLAVNIINPSGEAKTVEPGNRFAVA